MSLYLANDGTTHVRVNNNAIAKKYAQQLIDAGVPRDTVPTREMYKGIVSAKGVKSSDIVIEHPRKATLAELAALSTKDMSKKGERQEFDASAFAQTLADGKTPGLQPKGKK